MWNPLPAIGFIAGATMVFTVWILDVMHPLHAVASNAASAVAPSPPVAPPPPPRFRIDGGPGTNNCQGYVVTDTATGMQCLLIVGYGYGDKPAFSGWVPSSSQGAIK